MVLSDLSASVFSCTLHLYLFICFNIFLSSSEVMLIDFRERGSEGKEKERERNVNVRKKTSIGCLPHVPQLGTEPTA